jgi:hypothetical protein
MRLCSPKYFLFLQIQDIQFPFQVAEGKADVRGWTCCEGARFYAAGVLDGG